MRGACSDILDASFRVSAALLKSPVMGINFVSGKFTSICCISVLSLSSDRPCKIKSYPLYAAIIDNAWPIPPVAPVITQTCICVNILRHG